MPTYDYRCNACEHEFELFQSMTASTKKKCPECGKLTLERLIGIGAAVLFKGDGFYQTDYRSEGYKKAAEADKKQSSPSESKGCGTCGKPDGPCVSGDASSSNNKAGPAKSKASKPASGTSDPKKKRAARA